jgi:hypothetical protein
MHFEASKELVAKWKADKKIWSDGSSLSMFHQDTQIYRPSVELMMASTDYSILSDQQSLISFK